MKLKYSFEVVDMGDQVIAVPVGNNADQIHGVIKLNREAAEILQMLNDGLDEESIKTALGQKYDNDSSAIGSYVEKVIEYIENIGVAKE